MALMNAQDVANEPKASANENAGRWQPKRRRRWLMLAQGWSASDNPGSKTTKNFLTLKGFLAHAIPRDFLTLSGLDQDSSSVTQGCRWRSNPGLRLANAFGVNPGANIANSFSVIAFHCVSLDCIARAT